VWAEAAKEYPATWYKQPVFNEAMQEVGKGLLPIFKGTVEVEPGMKAIGDRVRDLNKRYQG
jgi:hypothetical protein